MSQDSSFNNNIESFVKWTSRSTRSENQSYLMMWSLFSVSYSAVTIGSRTRSRRADCCGLRRLMTSNGGLLGGAEATKLVDDIEDGVSVGGELDPGLGLAARAARLTQLKLECSRPNLTLRLKKENRKSLD